MPHVFLSALKYFNQDFSEGSWVSSVIPSPTPFVVRTLGFRQFSFHHAIRALPVPRLDGFTALRLSRHANFLSGFRL
jgi:hypothetical protein